MKSEQSYKGHLTMFVLNIIFGLNTSITKSVLSGTLTPSGIYFLRIAGACLLFWIASVFVKEHKVSSRDLLLLFFAGMLGVAVNQFSFVKGLSMTSPINAAIIVTLTPIITMILAAFYQKEPITQKKVIGVFIGAGGALLLILTSMQASNSGCIWGNMLCLLSALSYAFYLTAFKGLIMKHHPLTLMKWMFLFSTIVSLPVCLNDVEAIQWQAIPLDVYLRIGYIVILATFITYMFIPVGQKLLRPTTLSMYNYLQPLVASLAAVLIGQDQFGWNTVLAGILVFSGVYVVTQSKSRAQLESETSKK